MRIGVAKNEPAVPRLSTGGRASPNAEANESYERAILFLKARLDIPRARELLERTLELDPKLASARAYYGFTYLQTINQGLSNDRSLLYKAEEEVRRAQRDEPDLPLAHSFLGAIYLSQGRKELALEEAQKAIQPESGGRSRSGAVWLGLIEYLSGDYPAAKKQFQEISRNDPLFWPAHLFMSQILTEEGQLDAARVEGQKVLDQDPGNLLATMSLSYGQLTAGDVQGARALLEKARPEDKENFHLRLAWALVNAREGKRPVALDAELLKYAEVNPFVTSTAAEYYALRGDSANAVEWLDRAVHNGDERAEWFQRDPLLTNIRNQPRFKQILDSIAFRRQQRTRP